MSNKPGNFATRYRRNSSIIEAYDKGASAEELASQYGLTERQVYRIVSLEGRKNNHETYKYIQAITEVGVG